MRIGSLWAVALLLGMASPSAASPPLSPATAWEASRGGLGASCTWEGGCDTGLACDDGSCLPAAGTALRVMTYNVDGVDSRFSHAPAGGEPYLGGIAALICDSGADLIGIQEDYTTFGWAGYDQKCFPGDSGCSPVAAVLLETIEGTCPGRYSSGVEWDPGSFPDWTFSYTEGPRTGERADEPSQRYYPSGRRVFMGLNAILWRSGRFELRDAGTVPLCLVPLESDPDVCGPFQDSDGNEVGQDRSLRWMRFWDQDQQREFFFLNTHLQHNPGGVPVAVSAAIREQQADRIIGEIAAGFGVSPQHLVLMGDLNSHSSIPGKFVDEAALEWVAAGSEEIDHILVRGFESMAGYVSVVRREPWMAAEYCEGVPACSDHEARSAWLRYPAPPCSDGLDNDGDGETDFPTDLQCGSANDVSESPRCSDGVDNDGDGEIDLADLGCLGDPSRGTERECGLGFELVFVLPPLLWLYGRRGQRS